jgi:hypothetical protein
MTSSTAKSIESSTNMQKKNTKTAGSEAWSRKESAVHEAGHAVAYWAIGVLPYTVWIPAYRGEKFVDRRNRVRSLDGICDASFFNMLLPSSGIPLGGLPMPMRSIAVKHAQLNAMCAYAGPIAEARYRRCLLLRVLMTTGKDDFDSTLTTLRWLAPDENIYRRLELLVSAAARRLVKMYATSISALAEELVDKGQVGSERIDQIIRAQAGHARPNHGDPPLWLVPKLYVEPENG